MSGHHLFFVLLLATGLSLRSDVYVDTISRIEITTRTRELLLEEEPEKFEVRAFDDEGEITIACCVCAKKLLFGFLGGGFVYCKS